MDYSNKISPMHSSSSSSWNADSNTPRDDPPQYAHISMDNEKLKNSMEESGIVPFGFVSSDEPVSLHSLAPNTPSRTPSDSFKRPFASPFNKIHIVNSGSTPAQLHELKQQSRLLPPHSEAAGSRPGFSATPGPNKPLHGGYRLFNNNSQESNMIYSSIKNSEPNPPTSPDTRGLQGINSILSFMDSPDPIKYSAMGKDEEDKDMNNEDDESYHRGNSLFLESVVWKPQSSTVLQQWQRDNDSLQEPFCPHPVHDLQITNTDSHYHPPGYDGNETTLLLPTTCSEEPLDSRNTNQNKNKFIRSRNSHDRCSTTGNSFDSDVSVPFKKLALSLDAVRISNDSSKNANKQDFVESPRSKNAFKEFNSKFRICAKISLAEAENFVNQEVSIMPEHAKWRAFVELAELAKKHNAADKARFYYVKACGLEKRASTTWLEWSKMEEENGRPLEALKVLKVGLGICKWNDTLLPRSIKLHERLFLHDDIREFLSTLRQEPLERTWKSILEGCMFEARIGNYSRAREIYKFLMSYVPWYGPIYFEAFRLEEREGNDSQALSIIRAGLKELPRYGPLWFGLMRIMERKDIKMERQLWLIGEVPKLNELNHECDEAVKSISKELTWRVHYERFQAEERAAEIAAIGLCEQASSWSILSCRRFMLASCRKSLTQSLLLCPSNLRWKLFLVGARLELGLGYITTARDLIRRSFQEVPSKSKASVYIECSRLEEYIENYDVARSILFFAKNELHGDWRICLESILLEARRGNISTAVELAQEAVAIHPGTGRIWALYIQLNHRWESSTSFRLQKNYHMTRLMDHLMEFQEPHLYDQSVANHAPFLTMSPKNVIVRRAIMEVPKSGEVWCEEGRCRLNPFLLNDFDLAAAQQSFSFAIQFTPQYGDTFIEYLRLELLCQVVLTYICEEILFMPWHAFVLQDLSHDHESDLYCKALQQSLSGSAKYVNGNISRSTRRKVMQDILQLRYDFEKKLDPSGHHEFPQLLRRCINADPNYGSAWFHCRELPYDIPTHIMANAQRIIRLEMESCRLLYGRAVLLYIRKTLQLQIDKMGQLDLPHLGGKYVEDLMEDFQYCDHMQCLRPMDIRQEKDTDIHMAGTVGPLILEVEDALFCSTDFTTGIVDLNRSVFNPHNSEETRRRYLFGIDQIVA